MAEDVEYNGETKIWKSCKKPQFEYVNETIGEMFLKNRHFIEPTKVIESHYDTGVDQTMADIHRDSVTVAINMRELGLKQGDVVLFYSNNNGKITALTLGCYFMGLPVNYFETNFNSEYEKFTLELLSPTMILFQEEYRTNIETTVKNINLPNLKHLISIDGTSGSTVESTLFKCIPQTQLESFAAPALGDPQKVIASYLLTSGSTGLPKAVALSHASMQRGIMNRLDISKDNITSSFSPLRWITQSVLMLVSLILGIRRVCVFKNPTGPIGREIIRSKRITNLICTPTLLQNILQSLNQNNVDALDSVQTIMVVGEAPTPTIMELLEKFVPNVVFGTCYGMTEMCGAISINGYLAQGLELKIFNDNGETVGPMTKGQLVVRAPVPTMGYLNIGREKDFYEDGFFNTGDYGYMDDNNVLHMISRYKNLVRCKDNILIPNYVEDLISALPEVSSSILVGYQKSATATEDTAALFIVLTPEAETSTDILYTKIRELLKHQLKLEQNDIFEDIQIIEKLPLSSCGKVERSELKKLATQNFLARS